MLVALVLAAAVSQASYTLPEQRFFAPSPHLSPLEKPAWSHAVDAPGDGDMLAIGDGIVAFADHGELCAYDDKTGSGVWCSGKGSGPVFASGTIAYTTTENAIHAVDARTGKPQWELTETKSIWRTQNGLIASGAPIEDPQTRAFHAKVEGVGFDGVPRWSKILSADGFQAVATPEYLTWKTCEAGATTHCYSTVAQYSAGILGQVDGDVLGVSGSFIVNDLSFNEIEEVEDHFLVFNIGFFDSRKGAYAKQFTYAPDYQQNLSRWNHNACSGQQDALTKRLDGDTLYVVVCRNLYRYTLGPAASQRPLQIAGDVTFWGGPYRGTLYVERNDGLWALHPEDESIRAQLVVPSSVYVQNFAIAANMAFGVFRDGSVHGFDVDTGRTTFEATPCSGRNYIPIRVTATGKRIFIACASNGFWTLYAYAR